MQIQGLATQHDETHYEEDQEKMKRRNASLTLPEEDQHQKDDQESKSQSLTRK